MFEFDTTWFDMVCHGHGHLYGHSTAQRLRPIWLVSDVSSIWLDSDVTFIVVEIKVGKEIKFKSVGENTIYILIMAPDIEGLKTRK